MKTIIFLVIATFITALSVFLLQEPVNDPVSANTATVAPKKHLRSFGSERELTKYLRKLIRKPQGLGGGGGGGKEENVVLEDSMASTVEVTVSAAEKDEQVTNVQHAGVDEGGIIKVHGDFLVVLRRGRLFTIRIGNGSLQPISSIDAFGPEIDPDDSWYDEMLVSGDTIAVIGYSYDRGGTEIGLFNIDSSGGLKYRSTYHLRSNDYYSSRNYASRLIGKKLIFYSPLRLSLYNEEDIADSFPAYRKWHKGAKESEFKRIAPATRIYRGTEDPKSEDDLCLHTVTTCDIAGGEMECRATSVIGLEGNVFYVSPNSVYVWASPWDFYDNKAPNRSMLYRMPLNDSEPSALKVSGSPVDQFSFLESEDGHLNVVVRSLSGGDAMWSAEKAEGDIALMRIAIDSFSDGRRSAPLANYRALPMPEGYSFQNRFVGEHLLYGTGSGWGDPEKSPRSPLYITKWSGDGVTALPLPHGVDRIEVLGSDAIVVGPAGDDLYFTSIRLDDQPAAADSYVLKDATQGELRSHGFFYKAEDSDSGILGLPVRGGGRPGYEHLFDESASIVFLNNKQLKLTELGELKSNPETSDKDGCRASCVDWYGNARPLFIRGRIFALLGYEMVEGSMDGGRIRETRRINFTPKAQRVKRK